MPLLRVGAKEITHYEKKWLEEAIVRAAREAGHDKWWFAEDIAQGMIIYLQKHFPRNIITLQEIFDKIAKTLTTIGFTDIADKLVPTPPPLRISLIDIAREADSGYELSFFNLLDDKLSEVQGLGAEQIECAALRDAVLLLRSARKWNCGCETLQREIIDFVRERTNQNNKAEEFSLMVS